MAAISSVPVALCKLMFSNSLSTPSNEMYIKGMSECELEPISGMWVISYLVFTSWVKLEINIFVFVGKYLCMIPSVFKGFTPCESCNSPFKWPESFYVSHRVRQSVKHSILRKAMGRIHKNKYIHRLQISKAKEDIQIRICLIFGELWFQIKDWNIIIDLKTK